MRSRATERRTHAWRRGIATGELVVMASALGVVGVSAVVIVPRVAEAIGKQEGLAPDVVPSDPAQREPYEALRLLIVGCTEVLAVNPPTESGLTELVIWQIDEQRDGVIDPGEVVVITHSAFLGTVSAHSVSSSPDLLDPSYERLIAPIERVWATHPTFCASWRKRPDVTGRTVASQVDQMRLEPASGDGSTSGFYVRLTWASSASDESIPDAVFGVPHSAPLKAE
jgi:hypothetical protein